MTAFNANLRTKVIDGRIYVDMEQLVELIFDISNQSAVAATEMRDPALGVMTLGVAELGKALDGALEAKQGAAGLGPDSKDCSRSQRHPAHRWILGRQAYRCKGVAVQPET